MRIKSCDVPLAAREAKRFTVLNGHNVMLKKKKKRGSISKEKEKQEYGAHNWQSQPHTG